MPLWKHVRAIVLLPVMVTIVIPAWILDRRGMDTFGLSESAPLARLALAALGAALVALGLILFVASLRLFATKGGGTLAPWNPTRRLVVSGVYRHVRNPMISGVMAILLGESLLAASRPLFVWFLVFVALNAILIPLLEEPDLARRFGPAYEEYRRQVPRWIPRLHAGEPLPRSECDHESVH